MTEWTVLSDRVYSAWLGDSDDVGAKNQAWLLLTNHFDRAVRPRLAQKYHWAPEITETGWEFWTRAIEVLEKAAWDGRFEFQGTAQLITYLRTCVTRRIIKHIQGHLAAREVYQPASDELGFEEWIARQHRTETGFEQAPEDWDLGLPYCLAVVILNLALLCRHPSDLEPQNQKFLRSALRAVATVSLARSFERPTDKTLAEQLRRFIDHNPCPRECGECAQVTCPPMAVLAITHKHIHSCEGYLEEVKDNLADTWTADQIARHKSHIIRALRARHAL